MPGLTGTQLAERIKAHKPGLPIILATGYADMPPGASPGLIRLNKPFDQEALTRAISEDLKPADWRTVVPLRPR